MKSRLLAVLLIILLIIPVFSGCGQKQLTKVRLNEVVRSVFYAPQYVALSLGFFKQEGLDIELSTGQGSDKTMTAILSNNADIGLLGPETTVYVYTQGKDDYAVNFAQLTKRDGSFLVGRKDEPNFKWENLKGKIIIGGRPGGMPEMTLEHILKSHGLIPGKDVNIITNIQFTATAGAFKSGTGDYVALFEPTATILEKEGSGKIVASIGLASGEIPYTVYSARKSFIEKNPDIIQKFTNALYRGQLWVQNHSPEEIAQAIKPYFPDADMDVLTTVIKRYKEQDTWAKNPIFNPKDLDRMQDIIIEAGILNQKVDSKILIDNTFAEKAVKTIK